MANIFHAGEKMYLQRLTSDQDFLRSLFRSGDSTVPSDHGV
jgi:hypothetical protein